MTIASNAPSNTSNEDSKLHAKKTQNDQSDEVSRCFGNCMPSNLLCFKVWLQILIFLKLSNNNNNDSNLNKIPSLILIILSNNRC